MMSNYSCTCTKLLFIDVKCRNAQNPSHTFPSIRNFPVDGEAANMLRICYGETGVMDFGLNQPIL